jgi:hypothetical protein
MCPYSCLYHYPFFILDFFLEKFSFICIYNIMFVFFVFIIELFGKCIRGANEKYFTFVWARAAAMHSRRSAAVVAVRLLRHRPFPVVHYDSVSKVAPFSLFHINM